MKDCIFLHDELFVNKTEKVMVDQRADRELYGLFRTILLSSF